MRNLARVGPSRATQESCNRHQAVAAGCFPLPLVVGVPARRHDFHETCGCGAEAILAVRMTPTMRKR